MPKPLTTNTTTVTNETLKREGWLTCWLEDVDEARREIEKTVAELGKDFTNIYEELIARGVIERSTSEIGYLAFKRFLRDLNRRERQESEFEDTFEVEGTLEQRVAGLPCVGIVWWVGKFSCCVLGPLYPTS